MHNGTLGEQEIQKQQNSSQKAKNFYARQMKNCLNEKMKTLIANQEMVFIATSDAEGNCDCSPKFGTKGFVTVLNDKTLVFPEYKGNGVFASLGNIYENPHVGLVFIDFFDSTVGLHVNGRANSFSNSEILNVLEPFIEDLIKKSDAKVERWILVEIDEAYIHCSKHVPKLSKIDKEIKWGTDDKKAKSVDFFNNSQDK